MSSQSLRRASRLFSNHAVLTRRMQIGAQDAAWIRRMTTEVQTPSRSSRFRPFLIATAAGSVCAVGVLWSDRKDRAEETERRIQDKLEAEMHEQRCEELQRIRESASWRRLATLLLTLLPVAVCWPLWLLDPSTYWRLVASRFESCGPCFVKLSQWLATRRDIFPEAVCIELGRMHSSVSAPWGEQTSRERLEEVLKESSVPIRELEPLPRASGSIAEVFFGVLQDGSEIAVKCLRPGIKELLDADLAWLLRFSKLADHSQQLRLLGIRQAAEEFCEHIQMQTDFQVEASHLRRFRKNFASSGEAVRFPSPLFASQDVLVLSREEGQELAQIFAMADKLGDEGLSRQRSRLRAFRLAELLSSSSRQGSVAGPSSLSNSPSSSQTPVAVRSDVENIRVATGLEQADIQRIARESIACYMRMIFKDGFIHGDLHPGNIMLRLREDTGTSASASSTPAGHPSTPQALDQKPVEAADVRQGAASGSSSEEASGEQKSSVLGRMKNMMERPKVELVILDAGLAIPLPREKVEALRSLAISIVYHDFYRAADILYQQSPDSSRCWDPVAFKTKLAAAFCDCRKNIWEEGVVQVSDACLRAFHLVQYYNVGLDTTLTWALFGMLSVEGSAKRLDPEVDCAGAATRYIITLPFFLQEMGHQSWGTLWKMFKDMVVDHHGWEVEMRRAKAALLGEE
mmetsp:Transcript_39198/g.92283  ORF Transcript_39198/g.92283 Transcript_39198/m.92283 type:complete len:687 (-) Transcript_39198:179-2239(-)